MIVGANGGGVATAMVVMLSSLGDKAFVIDYLGKYD